MPSVPNPAGGALPCPPGRVGVPRLFEADLLEPVGTLGRGPPRPAACQPGRRPSRAGSAHLGPTGGPGGGGGRTLAGRRPGRRRGGGPGAAPAWEDDQAPDQPPVTAVTAPTARPGRPRTYSSAGVLRVLQELADEGDHEITVPGLVRELVGRLGCSRRTAYRLLYLANHEGLTDVPGLGADRRAPPPRPPPAPPVPRHPQGGRGRKPRGPHGG